MRRSKWAIICILLLVAAGCASRPIVGRSRPDLAALLSFDDGPLTFQRTYSSGQVGPFIIGESRSIILQRLSTVALLDQDKAQLSGRAPTWTVALSAESGGYSIYTLHFERERIVSVTAFYSVFQGL